MPSWNKLSAIVITSSLFTTLVADASAVKLPTSLASLYPRQSVPLDIGSLPASCKCQDFLSFIQDPNCGTDYKCICTNPEVINTLKACEQCVVDANMANQTVIDNNIAVLVSSCNATGEPDWQDLETGSPADSTVSSTSTSASGAPSQSNISASASGMPINILGCSIALALFLVALS